jgi:hypothetical protein
MRKHLVWILAIAFAATSVGIALAATDNVSTVSMKVTPKQLSKTLFKPAGIDLETTTTVNGDPGSPTDPTLFPDPTNRVVLKFDDDMKFSSKGLASKCTQAKLENSTDSAAAKAACPNDQVGTGTAVACVNNGSGGCATVGDLKNVEVLAFNGKPKPNSSDLSFLLWTNSPLAGITVLPAVLKKGGSGDYGSTLNVEVPPLGGGSGALTEFHALVKHKGYVKARCHDTDHKLNVKAKFTYTGGATADNVSDFSKCTT